MSETLKTQKLLCIHGYRQNGQAFREKTGAFRKLIKKTAELVFIDAPNVVPPLESDEDPGSNGQQLGWWFSRSDDYFNAKEVSTCDKGLSESFAVVEKAFKEQGPFDGVLGFSQGASFLSLMCGRLQQEKQECPFQFKYAILVAGFKSRTQDHDHFYTEKIQIPTLHVYGDTDKVIEKEMSEDLLQHYESPMVLSHSGGHFLPSSGPNKGMYKEFVLKMAQSS